MSRIASTAPDFRYTTATSAGPLYYRDGRWRLVVSKTNGGLGGLTWRGWTHGGEPFEERAELETWRRWVRGAVIIGEDEQ